MEMQAWVKWCVNHNLKVLVYLVWFLVLPLFLLAYLKDAVNDAIDSFDYIKTAKKDKL